MNTKRIPQFCLQISVVGLLIVSFGCRPKPTAIAKTAAPSKVEMVPHESDLATITLTKEASERLGITTVASELRKVQQHRTFGGEVVIPSGRSIMIAAPVAGIVSPSGNSKIPAPGSKVKAGDVVLALSPILSPERDVPTPAEQVQMAGAKATLVAAQVTALGDVQRGKADVAAAKINLDRAKKLLADRAGSQRAFDDAQALSNVAATVLTAAEERYAQLTKLIGSLEGSSSDDLASEITLKAPVDGVIRSLNISAGQQVVGGASLFEVLDMSTVWVRVPIFVDLLSSIQPNAPGRVVSLDGKPNNRTSHEVESLFQRALPIEAPPTADAGSSSADLYFEVSNQQSNLRPGQRIGIELPMESEVEATIVPAASVLYDINGGTWVYTQKEPLKFVRQRVTVLWFDGTQAILQRGPSSGTLVVADGAAELFGTEFGPGK
ncbi:MAG: efflux RND transporter periplasmic adaptor subunit [Planctomycetota bacterium]|nr:efflux RND transporter periplasmic adaptor subunit [Planctomycetota bacterium]